jgi:hypothetical protein
MRPQAGAAEGLGRDDIAFQQAPYPFVLSLSKDEASNLYFDKLSTNGFVSFKGVMFHSNVILL